MLAPPPPVIHQRARGRARVSFRAEDGRARLVDLHQSGCLKLRLPRVHRPVPEAVLINTAGGLTGGDALRVEAVLHRDAKLMLATQTAERLYRSPEDVARVEIALRAERGARLAWLPQETIAFEGFGLRRSLTVDLERGARLLAVEPLVLGRAAMGERPTRGTLRDDWRVRVEGRLVHAESLRVSGDVARWIDRAGGWNGRTAAATVLYLGPDAADHLHGVRGLIGGDGASDAWDGEHPRLVARILAADGFALRRRLEPLLAHLNARAMGLGCPEGQSLPAVWSL